MPIVLLRVILWLPWRLKVRLRMELGSWRPYHHVRLAPRERNSLFVHVVLSCFDLDISRLGDAFRDY